MKNIFILIVLFFAYNSFAKSTEVDVLSAEFGVADHTQRKSLCLTVVRVPANGSLLGVVESIEDCFYARQAKKSPNHKVKIDLKKLSALTSSELENYLQGFDTQLKYLFSEAE